MKNSQKNNGEITDTCGKIAGKIQDLPQAAPRIFVPWFLCLHSILAHDLFYEFVN